MLGMAMLRIDDMLNRCVPMITGMKFFLFLILRYCFKRVNL